MSTVQTSHDAIHIGFQDNASYLRWEVQQVQRRLQAMRRARDEGRVDAFLELVAQQRQQRLEMRAERRACLERGATIVAEVVARRFGLTPDEETLFFLALAPALSANTRRLMGSVQGLPGVRGLELGFLLELAFPERFLLSEPAWLAHGRRLVELGLIHLDPVAGGDRLSQRVEVPHCVASSLVGRLEVDARLRDAAEVRVPTTELFELVWPRRTAQQVEQLCQRLGGRGTEHPARSWSLLLIGDEGTGKTALAGALARLRRDTMFTLRCDRLAMSSATVTLLEVAAHNAAFVGAVWHVVQPDCMVRSGRPALVAALERLIADYPGPVVLETRPDGDLPALAAMVDEVIPIERPGVDAREQLWESVVPPDVEVHGEGRLRHLAGDYDLTGGQIASAVSWALSRAASQRRGHLTFEDLELGARTRLRVHTGGLTTGSEVDSGLDRLVLPEAQLGQVRALLSACRNRQRLLDEWGFGRRLITGKGLVALFSGEAGTGKTLTAELLAHELGVRLEIVNISEVVSKWLGETEKRIREIFRQARAQRSMLLFDEADALFGTRVQVERAQDQYQNMSVNHLLREIERFDGVVMLTTNLETNIDPAFSRRILFRIEFPVPDAAQRTCLWSSLVPSEAPLADDVDFEALGESFELSGGQIKNAVMRAAYACLEQDSALTYDALYDAAAHESQAAGRLTRRHDLVDEHW